MDETERLCFAADLEMALAPLAGQSLNLLTEIDVTLRVRAVLGKYIRRAISTEQVDATTYTLVVDAAFIATAREAIWRLRETLL